jgi:sortase A
MDFDHGGPSSSDRQRESAAEIARKKVLAAYSSTVENLKNLPASARDALMNNQDTSPQASPSDNTYTSVTTPEYQQTQPNWSQNTYDQAASYDRTPIYSQPETASTNTYTQPTQTIYTPDYQPYNTQSQTYEQPVSEPAQYDNIYSDTSVDEYSSEDPGALKDTPVNQTYINEEWQKYHSAWQDYYKNYYSDYYAKAAESYLATEKMKNERIATGKVQRDRNLRKFIPVGVIAFVILAGLFLQYNRLIFAPIMAYVSPDSGSVATSLEPVDPTVTQAVSPEPRLIIPKLNVDVPVAFSISTSDVDAAMNEGVAQFSIPGANALPGQIGNLVITGHSAGDIYSSNPYKFIFSGLERLEDGDLIYVNYNSVRYTYQMVGRETVEPSNVAALVYETDKPMLTLITCTPLGTSRYRLLISAEQISPSYTDAETAAPSEGSSSSDNAMPANEPSFFENIWQGIFGS